MNRPILAVDVDGVLNAMSRGVPPAGWRDVKIRPGYGDYGYPPKLRIRHNPSHGARLLQIAAEAGAELTWCTTWENDANTCISPLAGLPVLPWVPMEPGLAGQPFRATIGMTKAAAMRIYAGDRPFVWLDDEPDAASELKGCLTPHLVIWVDDEHGLQDFHFEQAWQWLTMVKEKREASHE